MCRCAIISQLCGCCSRAVLFFTQCQESKPAKPWRFEVVCMLPSEFHWGLLCCLAHASHPAESKCSQSKMCWRQQLCRSELKKAGNRGGLEGKNSLILSEMIHITARRPSWLQPPLLITHSVQMKSRQIQTNECLSNTTWCHKQRHLPDSISLSLSLVFLLFVLCLYPTPLRRGRTKKRDRRKAI